MPREFDSCVRQVKNVRNKYAVCRARLGSDADIKARRKRSRKKGRKHAKS